MDDARKCSANMTFNPIDNVVGLKEDDFEQAYVPDVAKAVLRNWDNVCMHYEASD